MAHWQGRSALVTGGGSGIGKALGGALARRGARVWLSDVDAEGVRAAADAIGGVTSAATLDVRDAAAFAKLAQGVEATEGRIDLLFNNAGIGVGGEVQELGPEHFDRVIDVNIRGVTNGVAAVYPGMVARRSGHIVNTASAAGLVAVPFMAPYAMSKHAVVGLSSSLRYEAARHGVAVTALCPTAIDTPLLDTTGPEDLSKPSWIPDIRAFLTRVAGAPVPVDRFVDAALAGVEKNRELVIEPWTARMLHRLQRWFPALVAIRMRQVVAQEIALRGK